MEEYVPKPKKVKAVRWDGTKPSMYRVIADILENGGEAWIKDGYASQGPDLIVLKTDFGDHQVLSNCWVILDGEKWKTVDDGTFTREYVKAPPDPKPPVMRGPGPHNE